MAGYEVNEVVESLGRVCSDRTEALTRKGLNSGYKAEKQAHKTLRNISTPPPPTYIILYNNSQYLHCIIQEQPTGTLDYTTAAHWHITLYNSSPHLHYTNSSQTEQIYSVVLN